MTLFSNDVNRSLDVLTTLAQNPNLPPHRKQEIDQKRRALKDSVEMTVTLQRQKNTPLNSALAKINEEGRRLNDELLNDALTGDADTQSGERVRAQFMNCADSVFCDGR